MCGRNTSSISPEVIQTAGFLDGSAREYFKNAGVNGISRRFVIFTILQIVLMIKIGGRACSKYGREKNLSARKRVLQKYESQNLSSYFLPLMEPKRSLSYLTFIGPCTVIYFYSNNNEIHQFFKLISFCSSSLDVSDGISVHHQESKIVHTASGMN